MQPPIRPKSFIALLLAQVGAHAAAQFAERLSALKLTPAHAGILRWLAQAGGISQRELAEGLGMHASRLVGIVDELEQMGLVTRLANAEDRRTYSLQLTAKGGEKLTEVGAVAFQHNEALGAALSAEERNVLAGLLQRIADQQGLIRGVHPGYASMPRKNRKAGKQADTANRE